MPNEIVTRVYDKQPGSDSSKWVCHTQQYQSYYVKSWVHMVLAGNVDDRIDSVKLTWGPKALPLL